MYNHSPNVQSYSIVVWSIPPSRRLRVSGLPGQSQLMGRGLHPASRFNGSSFVCDTAILELQFLRSLLLLTDTLLEFKFRHCVYLRRDPKTPFHALGSMRLLHRVKQNFEF